ncbi:hypothetical protein TNCT_353041 [Trichonephila clavata]|uniref:Uncharacterized protein n=1 Tax=Trichonephila clavata TaxID=2740835 RepID=A0A8X6I061_TRICU|nr:hypothetical protein TNCT_353041 [Trichonephila clavata]
MLFLESNQKRIFYKYPTARPISQITISLESTPPILEVWNLFYHHGAANKIRLANQWSKLNSSPYHIPNCSQSSSDRKYPRIPLDRLRYQVNRRKFFSTEGRDKIS